MMQVAIDWKAPAAALKCVNELLCAPRNRVSLAFGPCRVLARCVQLIIAGASAFVEAGYGLAFGLLYGATGNLFVSIAAHFLYDFASFIEVRAGAARQLSGDPQALCQVPCSLVAYFFQHDRCISIVLNVI
jgi:membrane protease YdiL (CAAX protease family)